MLATTSSNGCLARANGAWAVGSTSGAPVDLDSAGFAYSGKWDVPGLGTLVAQDRSLNNSRSSALGLIGATPPLGARPLASAGG